MQKKIAFVVVRYGESINGGAEVHCRMLANKLQLDYKVEIITTCVKNYITGTNEFDEGQSEENQIIIHRFPVSPNTDTPKAVLQKKSKLGRKIRRTLYRIGLLKPISYIKPIWKLNEINENNNFKGNVFYSPKLLDFISNHQNEYHCFIFLTYAYPTSILGTESVGNKSIFIPTAHNESALFYSSMTMLFNRVKHIAFNTTSERNLCHNIFGKGLSNHSIVGVGIETLPAENWITVKAKYDLPDQYVLYVGRIDPGKINKLTSMFQYFKTKYRNDVKLILTGGIHVKKVEDPDIIYTGFVSETEKSAIIQKATVVVNPSKYESLSLIALEAMWFKRPLLVNGNCDVLKEHCIRSKGAAKYYHNTSQFCIELNNIVSSNAVQMRMGELGHKYVTDNYDWSVILQKFKSIIESIDK